MARKVIKSLFCIVCLGGIFILLMTQMVQASESSPKDIDNSSAVAWVDTINISTVPTFTEALDQLEAGTIHVYTGWSSDSCLGYIWSKRFDYSLSSHLLLWGRLRKRAYQLSH